MGAPCCCDCCGLVTDSCDYYGLVTDGLLRFGYGDTGLECRTVL